METDPPRNPPRLDEIAEIFHAALAQAEAARAAFLDEVCKGDPERRAEVEALLAADRAAGSFGDQPFVTLPRNVTGVLPGRHLGQFRVEALLGSGGMGDVYRAQDTKLERAVAIKVLPEEFARDPRRLARFEREAKILASLSHPHIAHIHGLEEAEGVHALVMELVDGETLAQRLSRGRIVTEEALPLARQIAQALEAAHDKGIVHRDLKPANVMITHDEVVKVLDFGIAKLRAADAGDGEAAGPKTIDAPAAPAFEVTRDGALVGTAPYVSPEQARGKGVDERSDVWAFGCVLFEMLTGRPAFAGDTVADTIAATNRRDPDWAALPADTPPEVQRLLRRCLQKDPKRRLHHMADARIELEDASVMPVEGSGPPTGRSVLTPALLVAVTLGVGGVLGWFVKSVVSSDGQSAGAAQVGRSEIRLDLATTSTSDPFSLAISPDGRSIVFESGAGGRSRLSLRTLDAGSERPLAGTDGARFPFWSPDSRSVGFFADGWLKRMDIDSGVVQPLAIAAVGMGGSWNSDGTILFAPNGSDSIFRIRATGGAPAAVTRLELGDQRSHRFPQFLPDGRYFLYYVTGTPGTRGVYVGDLSGSSSVRLLDADAAAVHAPPGHVVFVRQNTLFAQPFDAATRAVAGEPVRVAESVTTEPAYFVAALSASPAGPIVYRTGSGIPRRQFIWVDRSGRESGRVGDPNDVSSVNPELSPNGDRVALYRRVGGNADVWLLDTKRGVLSRFTFDAATDASPVWSPDGSRIVFQTNRSGAFDLYLKPTTGTGGETVLLATKQTKSAADWSADGRYLLYRTVDPTTGFDIWALPFDGDRQPFPVVRTPFEERDGQFSPDGNWIVYQSNESGRMEIYVQPFPRSDSKLQISRNGGGQARWRRDGKELFYVALDGQLMSVPLALRSGVLVEAGAPVPLFATNVGGAVQGIERQQYMVSADGQRFLMNTVIEAATAPITVLLNWKAEPSGPDDSGTPAHPNIPR
jgi:serine/threonine protein kinase